MMLKIPCEKCERKGCGAYHDVCPDFKKYKAQNEAMKPEKIIFKDYINEATYRARIARKGRPRI